MTAKIEPWIELAVWEIDSRCLETGAFFNRNQAANIIAAHAPKQEPSVPVSNDPNKGMARIPGLLISDVRNTLQIEEYLSHHQAELDQLRVAFIKTLSEELAELCNEGEKK